MERSRSYVERSTSSSASGSHDLRCYSASYASSYAPPLPLPPAKEAQMKKAKSTTWSSSSSSSCGASASSKAVWGFGDPELQRKKRVAAYKAYDVEGKVKGSLRRSVRWLKGKYTQVVYGWW